MSNILPMIVVPKFYFWKGNGSVSVHFNDISNISEFTKILSLSCLATHSWCNSYTMFIVIDFMYHFTCGEANLH